MILGHIRRVKLRQYLNLLLDVLDFVFRTLQVDDLNSDRLLCAFFVSARVWARGEISRRYADRGRRDMTYPLYTSPNDPFPVM